MCCMTAAAKPVKDRNKSNQPNKLAYLYCVGMEWLDNYCIKDIDTSYIGLPERNWRIAFTNSEIGIHSTYISQTPGLSEYLGSITLRSVTTPSLDLGFHIGLRSFGFGYSWDALHAYSQKLNFSIGGKAWGIELLRQKSANINSFLTIDSLKSTPPPFNFDNYPLGEGKVMIINTNLTAWYALNSAHYSHNAAIKQAYIQKKTAGSLLLTLSYLNTDMAFNHDTTYKDVIPAILNKVEKMVTHQVAVGLGYGINYTPNDGKVLLHLSAVAQAVFYSINYVTYLDTVDTRYAAPSYTIRPKNPVHFTGSIRAAVSWEINDWVHLSARGQVDNIRFRAEANKGLADMSNWNWQAHLAIGVRLGVEKKDSRRILELSDGYRKPVKQEPPDTRLPKWITEYFFSPH